MLHRLERIDSTNLEIRRRIEAGLNGEERICVLAEIQEAGIGRDGRRWSSPQGGLWMSMAFRATGDPAIYTTLPLAMGLVVCEILEEDLELSARIKWPNDILINDGKLGGILCQSFSTSDARWLVVGIGINGNYSAGHFTERLRIRPTTLLDETGLTHDIPRLAERIYDRSFTAFSEHERVGIAPIIPLIQQRLAWIGTRVFSENSEAKVAVEGIVEGLDSDGKLLLRIDGTLRSFSSGELSRTSPSKNHTYGVKH